MVGNGHIELICKVQCRLAECPLWNAAEGRLYFTDIENCCLWLCDPVSGDTEKFYQGEKKISGFAFGRSGDLILCAENCVLKLYDDGRTETLFVMGFPEGERFNDITTDPVGRIYAGTMNYGLFLFEKGKGPQNLLKKANCSNGMTFSLDEKIFYHTATKDFLINSYDYDRASGAVSGCSEFLNSGATEEWPDGLTIDNDGCLWSAFWSGGVKRISPAGKVIEEFDVPAEHPTSVVFGGENMDELFITTAAGKIFRMKTAYRGRGEWPANF